MKHSFSNGTLKLAETEKSGGLLKKTTSLKLNQIREISMQKNIFLVMVVLRFMYLLINLINFKFLCLVLLKAFVI